MSEQYAYDQVPEHIQIFPNGMPDYPMARNLKVRPECMGLELPSVPFGDMTSSQRMNMYTTSAPQSLIVRGAEFPQVASGAEKEYLKYTFNATRFDQNAMILTAIPRYRVNVGMDHIKQCPLYLLVYYGEEDRKVHCKWVYSYTKGTNGFGWENFIDTSKLSTGSYIEKDETISHSRAVQGSKYCMGFNLETCYGTWPGTVEDAIVISDVAAKRAISTGYKELLIYINRNQIPVNLYGDRHTFKFMPDIGERVNPEGQICGVRRVDKLTYFADMTDQALIEVQPLHDDVYQHIDPGATVVDIEVFRNPNRKILTPGKIFSQLGKYETEMLHFCEQIIKTYEIECQQKGRLAGHTFTNAVIAAGSFLGTDRKKVLDTYRKTLAKYRRKDLPIDHILIKTILKYDIFPSRGSKFSSYFGNKGVISAIVPVEHMPINEHGVRAHFLMSPMGIPNRMNPGQIYVCWVSELCRVVMDEMRAQTDPMRAYELMLDLFMDLNPEYGKLIDTVAFPDKKGKLEFAKESMSREHLIVVMPPFLNHTNPEWVIRLTNKYNITQTPVTFSQLDVDGNFVRECTTKRKLFIGKMYVFMLCKVPFCKSSGMGYVNNLGVPITVKDSTIKSQTAIAPTAVRLGEDENRNITTTFGSVLAARLLSINANAPEISQEMAYMLLTAQKPTALMFISKTNEQIRQGSRTIAALRAMAEVTGIDLTDSIASQEEIDNFYNAPVCRDR